MSKSRRARLGVENLERRELLASSLIASFAGGVLRVEGTDGPDQIHIVENAGQISVEGVSIQSGGAPVKAVGVAAVQCVVVDGLAGDDNFWVNYGGGQLTPALQVTGDGGCDVLHSKGAAFAAGQADGIRKTIQTGGVVFALRSDGSLAIDGVQRLGGVKDIAAADAGSVYELQADGRVLRRYSNGGADTWISGGVAEMVGSRPGSFFYRTAAGELRHWAPGNDAALSSGVLSIAASDASDAVYELQADGRVLRRYSNGGADTWISGGVAEMVGSRPGSFFYRSAAGELRHWAPGNDAALASGVVSVVAAGEAGKVFELRTDGRVLRRHADGASDTWISGGVTAIALGQLIGEFYHLDTAGGLYKWNSDGMLSSHLSGQVRQIAPAPDGVFALLNDGRVLKYHAGSSSTWVGGGVRAIAPGQLIGEFYHLARIAHRGQTR